MKEKSFFKRLAGALSPEDNSAKDITILEDDAAVKRPGWAEEDELDGELPVDVYETAREIVIKAIVAGVKKEDLEISLSRDMVAIKGSRATETAIDDGDYFHQELFWGSFSRTILLPQEVDIEKAEATEDKGLLVIRLPKIDKGRQAKLRVKSV